MPMDQGSAGPAGQSEESGAPDQGGDKMVQAMMAVRSGMQSFGDALGGKIPPEAIDALHIAIQAYDKFLSLTQKAMGVEGSEPDEDDSMGSQNSNAQGKSNAIPADQALMGRQ